MISYQDAGVSISAAEKFVDLLKRRCYHTCSTNILSGIGGFCSLQYLPTGNYILATSTDGVGTKLILSQQMKEFGGLKTIGLDLVAMIMNDIITCGAIPISFLDYYACRNLAEDEKDNFKISLQIMDGIIEGCVISGCALVRR